MACGLIAALRARGRRVQGFKVGPDYIDASHHALASGRPGRNLDAFMSGPELIAPLALHGSAGAEISVIEGVMGLFDGATGRGELASTAHVAKLLDAPVILVVDGSAMSRSIAAIVHGFTSYDPEVWLAGVILNRVGSDTHETILRDALAPLGIPVLGALRRDSAVGMPERHLGLVPAQEREPATRAALTRLSETVAARVDIDGVVAVAESAPRLGGRAWSPDADGPVTPARIAIAGGPAFSFHYRENLELLEAAGAELLPFDPLGDGGLPAGAEALILAGGFPEVFGEGLAENAPLRARIREFVESGRPVVAECGGLLYLCESLDGHEMCGVLPARGRMTSRLTLGYREATATADTLIARVGERFRGHEFHYSQVDTSGRDDEAIWELSGRGETRREGVGRTNLHASYVHLHWAATPRAAPRIVRAASAAAIRT